LPAFDGAALAGCGALSISEEPGCIAAVSLPRTGVDADGLGRTGAAALPHPTANPNHAEQTNKLHKRVFIDLLFRPVTHHTRREPFHDNPFAVNTVNPNVKRTFGDRTHFKVQSINT
jgi:hypothetical protein